MDFSDRQEFLSRYAELCVTHGLNVQPGQLVNISAEVCHRDFAYLVAQAAYAKGAKYVHLDLVEPRMARLRIDESDEKWLSYVPSYLSPKYDELVAACGANLKILGSEDPDLLADADPKRVNTVRMNNYRSLRHFYSEGIGKSRVHWTIAAAATPAWGQKVFGTDCPPKVAERKLWDEIFSICRVTSPTFLEDWISHNDNLQRRAELLNGRRIRKLQFRGPGTDLTVCLSQQARFKGGRDMSPRGVEFEPNLP
ncbi:MAG: aminopeptidase, partial [Bdellovibrionales bacterium]|nr:aminopeptidase [Bdellovibrionales bacterium]